MKPLKILAALLLVLASACASIPAQSKTLIDNDSVQTLSNKTLDSSTIYQPLIGTCTPSVGGTATYTAQVCRYIKIGKLVVVSGQLGINTIGTGDTDFFSGLPFGVNGTQQAIGTLRYTNLSQSVVTLVGIAGTGTTSMSLYGMTGAGTTLSQLSVLGNSTNIWFTLSYESSN